MKRGYMAWDQALLPQEQLKKRQQLFIKDFRKNNIDATIVYGDVAFADELQYLTNLGPYWANATGIFFKDGSVLIVTGLSARVNPWISSITGISEDHIISAGPKLSTKLPEILKEHLGKNAVIGLTGRYLPQGIVESLEAAGFKTELYQNPINEQLSIRDSSYLETIKQGIKIMIGAIDTVLKNPEIKGMTQKRISTELEYACRTAGAMDILILNANKDLIFDQPREFPVNDEPWTVFVQIQYLGEWIVIARSINSGHGKAALAAREKTVEKLVKGRHDRTWKENGYTYIIHEKIISAHLSSQVEKSCMLSEGQVVSLSVEDKSCGLYLQDMYQVTVDGGKQLTKF